jgi:TolB-like protein/Flp pilus assembly protein TadD
LRYSLASAALVALILAAWLGARFTKRPSVNSAEAGKKASVLAVLPFENLTGDPSQEYISDGLTEETISYLSRLNAQRLGVIARTSAMAYKGSTKRVDQIARELKADYVLEGSIRRSGERLRVTAQLIRAADQNHLWAYSYDVAMSDILTVQVQAAEAISNEVQIYLTPLEKQRLAGLHVASAEVYKTYLKGLYFLHQRSFASLTQAQASFEEAVSKDPQYAPAYAGLADTLNLQAFYAVSETPDVKQRAAEAAMTALRLDESLPQGHAALGYAKFMWFWDWAGAEREFQRALQLNPTYAPAHHWYALFLSAMARHKEAIEQVQRAQQIDPFSPAVQAGAGYVYYLARDFDQAVEQCRLALEMNPALAPAYAVAGWSYDQKGMYDDAIRNLEKAETLSGQMPLYSATRARVLARAGRKREAQTILRRLEAALAAEDSSKLARTSRHDVALVASALGDHRRALQLMNQAYSRNLGYFVWLKVDPMYDELRDEPGFTELARRVGLPD